MSLKGRTRNLPSKPGVYLLKDSKSNIIYVGKAKSLKHRLAWYFQKNSPRDARIQALVSKTVDFETMVTDSEMEALILEANLVKEHHPKYNVNLKDDKRYPYLKVTAQERFPRLLVVRRIKRDRAKYFGPYTEVKNMRQVLRSIRRIFPIRSCSQSLPLKRASRPCLNFHIRRCLAPCQGNIREGEYSELMGGVIMFLSGKNEALADELKKKMEQYVEAQNYEMAAQVRDQLRALAAVMQRQKVSDIQKIDRDIVAFSRQHRDVCVVTFQIRDGILIGRQHFYLSVLQDSSDGEMLASFLKQYYLNCPFVPKQIILPVRVEDQESILSWLENKRQEKVELMFPQKGDKMKLLEMAASNAKLLLDELLLHKAQDKETIPISVRFLKQNLYLDVFPKVIVAFDISNLGKADAVGSLVYFENGKPRKNQYRKFRIKTVLGQDDFAMIEEVVKRYFSGLMENRLKFPDLVLVDGGKGQMNSALRALASLGIRNQAVVGLAKRLDEVFLPDKKESLMIPKTSPALRLLKKVRDEAHRFAITYHRQIRAKEITSSEMDEIKGIGEKRKVTLLQHFGSVDRMKSAELEELVEVEGIGRKTAEVVHDFFHNK